MKERIALYMPILSSFSEVTGGRLQSRVLLAYLESNKDSQKNRVALGNNSLGHSNGSEILYFYLYAFQVIIFCCLDYIIYKGHLITILMRHYLCKAMKIFHTYMIFLLNTVNCLILNSSANKYFGWCNYV